MAVSKMKKLSVLTNRENLRALVARLCALRCVELSEEALGSEADGTALESGGDPVAKSALERDIAALTDALAVLHKYAKETKSLLDPKTCADVMRFDDTPEYAAARSLPRRASVYLSLGRREPQTKHPLMARVGEETQRQYERLQCDPNAENIAFHWNDGGHFSDPAGRMAAGFAWLADAVK